ncbi:hypothetical protein IFR04_005058 [Cadophora malorum]|uniref:Uncharacterized protein n=1 Tax=Cadophora malorum TaxID=108018 RepID=A0A8H7TMY0_9HELO|nr:hypothetical protein IFR04_005058 [Cadophora malorum]
MVPFAQTDSHTGIEMGFMLDYATGNSEEEGPVIKYERRHFTAKFVVTTAAWDDKQHKMKSANAAHGPDLDVLPISRSSLNRTIRAGTNITRYWDHLRIKAADLPRVKSKKNRSDADK